MDDFIARDMWPRVQGKIESHVRNVVKANATKKAAAAVAGAEGLADAPAAASSPRRRRRRRRLAADDSGAVGVRLPRTTPDAATAARFGAAEGS